MNQILITGASGLLGKHVALSVAPTANVWWGFNQNGVSPKALNAVQLDISNAESVKQAVDLVQPTVVVHCAAETRVDYCETHPEHARLANVEGTENLAKATATAKFVYISTDSVFDGRRGGYSEADTPNPVNVYARTKLAGEQVAGTYCRDCLILRTNFFGTGSRDGGSLAEWALARARQGEPFTGFADVWFSPLSVTDVSEVVRESINLGLSGVYHTGSGNRCSKLDFIRSLLSEFGMDADLVKEGRSADVDTPAERPKDTSMDTRNISDALGRKMPTVLESLKRYRSGLIERASNRGDS